MKWNEYNAAVSTSTESVRTDSLVRRNPETPATENKKPNRTRNNKITVYLSDAELARLNAMVDKTIMEAPPAPLFQTVRMMKNVHFNLDRISKNVYLSEPLDEELLHQTLSDLKVCLKEITERCLPPEEREVTSHESRPHRSGPDRVR